MPEPYSNRELDAAFKRADDRADEFHNVLMQRMDTFESNTSVQLQSIEIQTKKTNGSVANLKTWRTYTIGFLAGLTLAFGVLAFFIGQVLIPLVTAEIQNSK